MDFYEGVLGMPLIKTIELPVPTDVRHEPRTAADRTA